jgi:hypothetical protein
MTSYSDAIHYGEIPDTWKNANWRISQALLAIGQEFGDEVHTSGRADYLVRFLVNASTTNVQERIPNYFLVLVNRDGVDTVAKVVDAEPYRAGALTFQRAWEDDICDRFRDFRRQLADLKH